MTKDHQAIGCDIVNRITLLSFDKKFSNMYKDKMIISVMITIVLNFYLFTLGRICSGFALQTVRQLFEIIGRFTISRQPKWCFHLCIFFFSITFMAKTKAHFFSKRYSRLHYNPLLL